MFLTHSVGRDHRAGDVRVSTEVAKALGVLLYRRHARRGDLKQPVGDLAVLLNTEFELLAEKHLRIRKSSRVEPFSHGVVVAVDDLLAVRTKNVLEHHPTFLKDIP